MAASSKEGWMGKETRKTQLSEIQKLDRGVANEVDMGEERTRRSSWGRESRRRTRRKRKG